MSALKTNMLRARAAAVEFETDHLYRTHYISAEGIRPDQEKLKRINEWSRPESSTQMHAFLGLVRYLAPFLPKLADFASILDEFTTKAADRAFQHCTPAAQSLSGSQRARPQRRLPYGH